MKVFFLLFLLVPLTELYVMIEVGSVIGALPTVLLTVFTAIVGAYLMRSQGMMTMQKVQSALASGQTPEIAMLEGVMIFIGGLFLLLPGFITDTLGLLFLIPPIRHKMVQGFLKSRQAGFRGRYHYTQKQTVYDGEWSESHQDATGQKSIQQLDVIEGELLDEPSRKK